MHRTLTTAALATSLLLSALACAQPPQGQATSGAPAPSISMDEAERWLQQKPDLVLLDVRTPGEYASGHLEGARLIPVQELERRLAELQPVQGRPILVYCRTQNRSAVAQRILQGAGYQATFMQGGASAWAASGRPLVK